MDSIFEDRYLVTVPVMATFLNNQDPYMGIAVNTVNGEKVKRDLTEPTTVALTIYELAEVNSNGMGITLVRNGDLVVLYTVLENLFNFIDNPNTRSPNAIRRLDDKTLSMLDEFAHMIFELNGKELVRHEEKMIDQSFAGDFANIGLLSMNDGNSDRAIIERSRRTRKAIRVDSEIFKD